MSRKKARAVDFPHDPNKYMLSVLQFIDRNGKVEGTIRIEGRGKLQ
jgi:hypothetical protein